MLLVIKCTPVLEILNANSRHFELITLVSHVFFHAVLWPIIFYLLFPLPSMILPYPLRCDSITYLNFLSLIPYCCSGINLLESCILTGDIVSKISTFEFTATTS